MEQEKVMPEEKGIFCAVSTAMTDSLGRWKEAWWGFWSTTKVVVPWSGAATTYLHEGSLPWRSEEGRNISLLLNSILIYETTREPEK